jgi:hypothetical protein
MQIMTQAKCKHMADLSAHLKILFGNLAMMLYWLQLQIFSCNKNTNNQVSSINFRMKWKNLTWATWRQALNKRAARGMLQGFFEIFLFSTSLFDQMDPGR